MEQTSLRCTGLTVHGQHSQPRSFSGLLAEPEQGSAPFAFLPGKPCMPH